MVDPKNVAGVPRQHDETTIIDAAQAVEKAIIEDFDSLDCDDMLDAGLHVLGDKHPAVVELQKALEAVDPAGTTRIVQIHKRFMESAFNPLLPMQ